MLFHRLKGPQFQSIHVSTRIILDNNKGINAYIDLLLMCFSQSQNGIFQRFIRCIVIRMNSPAFVLFFAICYWIFAIWFEKGLPFSDKRWDGYMLFFMHIICNRYSIISCIFHWYNNFLLLFSDFDLWTEPMHENFFTKSNATVNNSIVATEKDRAKKCCRLEQITITTAIFQMGQHISSE